MIDQRLLTLTNETRLLLKCDLRQSEKAAIREKFVQDVQALMDTALAEVTDAQKIAFFDSQAQEEVDDLKAEMDERIQNDFCDDTRSDNAHYLWEEFRQAILGPKVFESTNQFNGIFKQ